MKNKSTSAIVFTILGLLLLVIGFILMKTIEDPQGIMRALPYVLIGIGCGVFGQNLGEIISNRTLKKYPDEAKKIEIERKDERNLMLSYRAKAKAYDLMVYVYGAVMLIFALMQVDIITIMILVLSYLFIIFSGVYFRSKYEKEM